MHTIIMYKKYYVAWMKKLQNCDLIVAPITRAEIILTTVLLYQYRNLHCDRNHARSVLKSPSSFRIKKL